MGTINLFPFLGTVLDAYPRGASGAYALEGYTTMLLVSAIIALGCTLMMKETFRG